MITLETLKNILLDYDVPIDKYGTGKAKTLDDFLNEIQNKECELIIWGSKVYRKTVVMRVKVTYEQFILKEVKQEFSDGREPRERGFLWVSEKMSSDENIYTAFQRAMKEELGIRDVAAVQAIRKGEDEENKESPSYPGIETKYIFVNIKCILMEHQFKKEGYVEKETSTGLTTYFEWVDAD